MNRASPLVLAVAALLAAVTISVALDGAEPDTPLRHLYLVPVVVGALAFGLTGGLLAAVGALLLFAPVVLPDVERHGLTQAGREALFTLVLLLGVGAVVGALRNDAWRRGRRSSLVVAVQELLARDEPLPSLLHQLRGFLIARLDLTDAALVLIDGQCASATGEAAAPPSLVSDVMRRGVPAFVPDVGGRLRPRRVAVVPLGGGAVPVGALVVEAEEISAYDRAELVALGAYVGLALGNARLALRQRRAAEELESKVAAATRHLAEMDRAKSTFVAIASHELRTPLTALLGFGELLATRAFAASEVRRLATIIHRETARLVRLVDDLLDLSRLERGAAPMLRRAAVRPARALAGVAELFRAETGDRLRVECDAALPPVDADADALDRVLKNLVSNALKYSPPSVPVRLIAALERETAVRFTVEDAGPGIAPGALPHVFEPYYRAPGAAGKAPGTGLGLAVVKALVEAHGGSLDITSEQGRGTRISFTLPRAAEPEVGVPVSA